MYCSSSCLAAVRDGKLNEGAAIQAEPAGAFLQDLPPFICDADGEIAFVHFLFSNRLLVVVPQSSR